MSGNPLKFFASASAFRAWLEEHHDRAQELFVGFYKKNSDQPSISWPEAVDAALCFGWIDGVRKSIDELSYCIRFTPRKPSSIWSAINIRRVEELTRMGLMQPTGLKAFGRRKEEKSRIYAYEQRQVASFDRAHEKQFRANKKAWDFFQAQAPWYRKTAHLVGSKREAR